MPARYHSSSEKSRANIPQARNSCFECATHETFAETVSHLVYDHNLFVRCELVRLERLLETVCEESPCPLDDLSRAFDVLKSVLTTLMEFEEETLFPLITRLERVPIVATDSPEAIGMMTAAKRQSDAYADAMQLLERVRSCALACEPPEEVPLLFSCVLYDLATFDEELRKRVELKEDLFRRAIVELPLKRQRKSAQRVSRRERVVPVQHHPA